MRGLVLEAQLALDGGFLVLTTDDSPFEEALHLTLLDAHLAVEDERTLSVPYRPGAVTDLRVVSAEAVELSFFGKDRWRVTVHRQARRRLRAHPGAGLGDRLAKHRLELARVG